MDTQENFSCQNTKIDPLRKSQGSITIEQPSSTIRQPVETTQVNWRH
jgi:hypothetical protein